MNLKTTICFYCIVFPIFVQSQGENNEWIFGNGVQLSFANGNPKVKSISTPLNTIEGSTSVSDSKGKLLFYSDGLNVYDRNHSIMPNGYDLCGDKSSTSSAVAVPYPGNKNLYYLFCVDYNLSENHKGLTYNIIDMTLNEGKGDIVMKNRTLVTPTDEKIAVTKQCDSKGFWVVVHKAFTDSFLSYNITENGLNEVPVVSLIQSPVGKYPEIGYLKFSPSGKWLVNAGTLHERLELFSFNKKTGQITLEAFDETQYQRKINRKIQTYYGVAFSSEEKYLYVSTLEVGEVFQYNLMLPVHKILTNRVLICKLYHFSGAMQLGKDKRIYFTDGYNSRFLNCIRHPDNHGLLCEVRLHEIYFGEEKNTNIGLPTLIETSLNYYNLGQDVIIHNTNNFKLDAKIAGGRYLWSTGETTKSIKVSDTGGIYWVTVFDTSACLFYSDTIRVLVYKNFSVKMPDMSNLNYCSNSQASGKSLKSLEPGITFLWINDNVEVGLGESGRGSIPIFQVPYCTDKRVARVKIYPVKDGFIGNPDSLYILITPSPILDIFQIKTYEYCDGDKADYIHFTIRKNPGVIKWYNNNIQTGLTDSGNSTIQAFICKAEYAPFSSYITVKAWHMNCPGNTESFFINVYPKPEIDTIPDIEICAGDEVPQLKINSNVNGSTLHTYHPFFPEKEVELHPQFIELVKIPRSDNVIENQMYVYSKFKHCKGKTDTFMYRIKPLPTADFEYASNIEDTGFFNSELYLNNRSYAYSKFKWIVNGIEDSSSENLKIRIQTNMLHKVEMRVQNNFGCYDTKTQNIEISRYSHFFMPNAFSPNEDGNNDLFSFKTFGMQSWSIRILNRWGEQIYVGDQFTSFWDGTYKTEDVPEGVYTWVIQGIDMQGKVFSTGGTVTVLR